MGFQATDWHRWQSSGFYSWRRVFPYVNYNNVYGRWITIQYLRQIKDNSKLTIVDSTSGWKSSLGKIYKQNSERPRKSTLNSGRATGQRRKKLSAKDRGCKEAATKYNNYTANKADEEREHQLSTFQQNAVNRIRNETELEWSRGKFTVKIIFFDATIGSENYTICKIDMRKIFLTHWGQPGA